MSDQTPKPKPTIHYRALGVTVSTSVTETPFVQSLSPERALFSPAEARELAAGFIAAAEAIEEAQR